MLSSTYENRTVEVVRMKRKQPCPYCGVICKKETVECALEKMNQMFDELWEAMEGFNNRLDTLEYTRDNVRENKEDIADLRETIETIRERVNTVRFGSLRSSDWRPHR